jgi:hypothetical protein
MDAYFSDTQHSGGGDHASLSVGFCERCNAFHVRAGKVWLTFSREEFAAFALAIEACYEEHLALPDSLNLASALSSDLIA